MPNLDSQDYSLKIKIIHFMVSDKIISVNLQQRIASHYNKHSDKWKIQTSRSSRTLYAGSSIQSYSLKLVIFMVAEKQPLIKFNLWILRQEKAISMSQIKYYNLLPFSKGKSIMSVVDLNIPFLAQKRINCMD